MKSFEEKWLPPSDGSITMLDTQFSNFKIPLFTIDIWRDAYNSIRDVIGQEGLTAYDEWSKIDSENASYINRIDYFDVKCEKFKQFMATYKEVKP